MSLLTGQYPTSHGVIVDGAALVPEKQTLAEYLSARGYATGGFVSGPYLHRAYGFDQGFEIYEHCVNYGEKTNEKGRVKNVIAVNLRSQSGVTGPRLDERVRAWLERIPPGKPYFLFVHYWDPHYDFEPPTPYDRVFDPGYSGRFSGLGFLQNSKIAADMPARDRKQLLDLYRGEIRYTDRWIDSLLKRLESRGELDRTLVVVVGDHGEEFFEHGNKGHRLNLYEETLEIPLIVRLPGVYEGGRVAEPPVSLVDVFPTVVSLLEEERPAEVMGHALDAIRSGAVSRAGVVAELYQRFSSLTGTEWKLILDRETGQGELYSRREDPGERRDLSAEREEKTREMKRALVEAEPQRFAPGNAPVPELDPATEEELRALGYTD
jgi:arylsulfatase